MRRRAPSVGAAFLVGAALASVCAAESGGDAAAVDRGRYIFDAAGCFGCHTDVKGKGATLAGGRALTTPFGTFYSPNITPDPKSGIGGWTLEDFTRALRRGTAPDGGSYYPVFPYPSFTGMTDADVAALWAYLRTVPPVAQSNKEHKIRFPYGWRWLNRVWKALYFSPERFDAGPAPTDSTDPEAWRRGAYLVNALSHCGECHTPRGALGAKRQDLRLGGNPSGPDGKPVPNITPDPTHGIGRWSVDDITTYLQLGMDPTGDFAGGAMAEVVERTTGKLTPEDRLAIAVYLRALPPVDRAVAPVPGAPREQR